MSTIVIACPICLQKIRAPGNVIGRQIRCPQCKNGFTAADPAKVSTEPIPALRQAVREVPADTERAAPAVDPLGLDDDVSFPTGEPQARGGPGFVDYIMFRRLVTPAILIGLFYFGVAVIVLVALVVGAMTIMVIVQRSIPMPMGVLTILLDFVIALSALMMWRVTCEALTALFRIADRLSEMNDRTSV